LFAELQGSGVARNLRPTKIKVMHRDGRMEEETIDKVSGQIHSTDKGKGYVPAYLKDQSEQLSRLIPKKYDSNASKWVDHNIHDSNNNNTLIQPPDSLKFLTYNVWFAEEYWKERANAMINIFQNLHPDVICLQEVTPLYLFHLLEQPFIRESYYVSDSNANTIEPYGVVIFIKTSLPIISFIKYLLPSAMARHLLRAQLKFELKEQSKGMNKNIIMNIGTVHLESLHNPDKRKLQLQTIFPILQTEDASENGEESKEKEAKKNVENFLLMGDFNFCGDSKENKIIHKLDAGAIDIWPNLHPNDKGETMRGEGTRIDRVLLHSNLYVPATIQILGTNPISADLPKVYPSDHNGLCAVIKKKI